MTLLHRVYVQSLRDLRAAPAPDVMAAASSLLARLLRHAAVAAPFHRSSSPSLLAAADGDRDAWAALPILSREQIGRRAADLLCAELPAREEALPDQRSWTSLSTPIEGPLGRLADVADKAQWEELARAAGIDRHGRLAALLPGHALGPGDMGAALEPWSLDANWGRAGRWPSHFPPDIVLDWLANLAPSCLFVDGPTLARLAGAARPGALAIDDVLLWDTGSGGSAAARAAEVWGARVHRAIASDLAGFVAYPHPGGGFAPAIETAFVEIVDDLGRPLDDGRPGRLVVTPLYGYRRPLIRLATGARARWTEIPGAGGRGAFEIVGPDG